MSKALAFFRQAATIAIAAGSLIGCSQLDAAAPENVQIADSALKVQLNSDSTYNIWASPDRFNLTYCISNASTQFQNNWNRIVSAMDSAARSWSNRVAVHFQYVPSANGSCVGNSSVVFSVGYGGTGSGGATLEAVSFFPHDSRDKRNLAIYDPGLGPSYQYGEDLDQVIRHEMGHILGFVHEGIGYHFDPQSPSLVCNPTLNNKEGVTYSSLTPMDTTSVMYYPWCRIPAGGGFHQSEADYGGAIRVYGMAPPLVNSSVLAFL